MRIYLIGMMGAGKSTVGRLLAQRLGWDFVDMDREIEREQGCSITTIFSEQGEAAFRKMESGLLERLSSRTRCVIATGGGAVLDPANQRLMSRSGLVVYLRVSAETVLLRTRSDRSRPNLVSDDKAARVAELLEKRGPVYFATADISFRSTDEHPGALASRIAAHRRVRALAGGEERREE